MNLNNPSAKGLVEAALQHLASQTPQKFATTPFRRNSRVSIRRDTSLPYDNFVQIVVTAIVELNRTL